MLFKDTWKFRRSALEFMNEGAYTKEAKSPNPVSKYMRFWQEEVRRSLYGYTVDNTTITGYHYFYLNYSPIIKAKAIDPTSQISEDVDYISAERIEGFPDFWDGDYEWFHYLDEAEKRGEHGLCLKARTKGASCKGGSMANRNYTLIPNSKTFIYAYDNQYLTGDGILDKAWNMMDFMDINTAWGKRRSINQMYHKRAGYKEKNDRGQEVEKGFKSEIFGVSINDGWRKVRGKRAKLILWEESGANPYLLQAWNVALNSMKSGNRSFGLMCSFGTGGQEGIDIEGLAEMFYNSGYGIYHIPNKYEEGHTATKCGFFFPMWKNLEGFMDADGNSNEAAAKEYLLKQREKIKAETKDIGAIIRKMAEEPLTPREALMRVGGNFFPVNELNDILADLISDTRTRDAEYIGKLELAGDGTVTWRPDDTLRPIREFPLKYDGSNIKDKEGCIVIWEMPQKNSDGVIPSGVYLAGNDPYDMDDAGSSDSLGSTFIFNKVSDRIVAEYTGRPNTANQYYENVRKLLIFYNARCNYENNLRGFFSYLDNKHCSHLLTDTPKIIYDKIDNKSVIQRNKGTPGTLPIKKFGIELIKQWLLSPNQADGKQNMYSIKSVPLLKELIYFSLKNGNYDRVLALAYLMIQREENMKIVVDPENRIKTLADDPFWKKHYNTLDGGKTMFR